MLVIYGLTFHNSEVRSCMEVGVGVDCCNNFNAEFPPTYWFLL